MTDDLDVRWYSADQIVTIIERYRELVSDTGDWWPWLGTNWPRAVTRFGPDHQLYCIPTTHAHRAEMLLSPHYQTLYKAWKIRYGDNHGCDNTH